MAEYTKMDMNKFKQAVNGLPDDPSQSVEFRAFYASRKGNKDDIFFGLYIDQGMMSKFKSESDDGFETVTKMLGTIRRSVKYPKRRLFVSLAKPNPLPPWLLKELKRLGKTVMKKNSLKYTLTVASDGEPEPELSPDEAQEIAAIDLELGQHGRAAPPPPGQAAPVAAPAAAPVTPDAAALARFNARIRYLMLDIRFAPADLAKVARDASDIAAANPQKANAMLNVFEMQLEKRPQDDYMRTAATLRQMSMECAAEKLNGDAGVQSKLRAVSDILTTGQVSESDKIKLFPKALLNLQEEMERARTSKAAKQHKKAVIREMLRADNFNTNEFELDDFIELLCRKFNIGQDEALVMFNLYLKQLTEGAAALQPKGVKYQHGWRADRAMINLLLPEQSRPKLTKDEAMAVNDYSGPPYKVINAALLSGKMPPPPHDKTYKLVRSAFQKAQPFDEPVLVTRGLIFDENVPIELERMNELLAKFNSIVGTRQMMRLTCFNSTGTSGIPKLFQGNVLLSIYAKSGLDLMAYSKTAHERELLLDNETPVLCHSCLKKGNVWYVELEQVLEKKK